MNLSNFPTKENPQLCKNGCGAKIYLSNETGKYLPYNLDDTQHDCRDRDRETPSKKPEKQTKQEFTLEMVLKKLESIGIKINLMELMKNE